MNRARTGDPGTKMNALLPPVPLRSPAADRELLAGEDDLAVGQVVIQNDAGADAGVDADFDAGHQDGVDAGAAVIAQIARVLAVLPDDYQINGTGYWRKMESPLARVAFSTRATATRRRSNGSRCTIGNWCRAMT